MSDYLVLFLWLFPLLVVAVLGFMWLIGRILQQKAEQGLRDLRQVLRRFQSERQKAEFKSQSFSGLDREPYRTLSTNLVEKLAALDSQMNDLERGYISLHDRFASLKHNPWRNLVGAPFLWYSLRRDIDRMEASLSQLQPILEQAIEFEQEIDDLPWQIAIQVRELRRQQQEAGRLLAGLRSHGLYGDTFETASSLELRLQTALSQIPELFFEGQQADLFQTASIEDTARAYDIVRINQPLLDQLLDHSRRWNSEYESTMTVLETMLHDLEDLSQTLVNLPEAANISEEQAALRQLEVIAQNLQAASSRFEVESMPLVAQEAGRLRQSIRGQSQVLKLARRQFSSLELLLSDIQNGSNQLSLQLTALSAKSIYPIHWESSLEELARYNQQANALGNASHVRTPGQVRQDFKTAAEISMQQKELSRYVQGIENAHAELVALLELPEVDRLPNWVRTARYLTQQASRYAPENWSKTADLSTLPADIETFAARVERLVSGDPSEPISDLDLTGRLEQTRNLLEESRPLVTRIESLRVQVENLLHSEAQALEKLGEAQKSLVQIRLIANSNQFLAGLVSQEIDRMIRKSQDLQEALENPLRGSLDKKASQAASLYERVASSANRWLQQLDKELKNLKKDLAESLSELDLIARLEDPSVDETRRVLSSQSAHTAEVPVEKSRRSLPEIVAELKLRSSDYQECIAVQHALENIKPLLETYHEASMQRDQTRQQLSDSPGWNDKKLSWPAVSTGLETDRQELERLETEWLALKQRSDKAVSIAALYSQISSRYQKLAENVHQTVARRENEQIQVEELDAQIAEQAERWETLLRQYQDNPYTGREIQNFLDDLDKSLERIERAYLRGQLDYDEVIQQMKTNLRRVRFYQVALDDEYALDASGRVSRRYQAERE